MKRVLPLVMAAAIVTSFAPAALAGGGVDVTIPPACRSSLLVVSAFPAEIDHLIAAARIEQTEVVDGRTFYVGTLAGNRVILAMTGIGTVNARSTTRTAFAHFTCDSRSEISAAVFSGVSGGKSFIGDVTVPSRWTEDGKTWLRVDRDMFATARAAARVVKLARTNPAGDPACVGADPDLVPTVEVERQPRVILGGDGKTADPFGGRRFPCFPEGGDVFGCDPCRAPEHQPPDVPRFVTGIAPFLDPNFFLSYFQNPPPSGSTYTAEDMETAAFAKVVAAHHVPFIAFRALSDGKGDPLMLPGFPFQFFVYRQLAADNAARMTLAFLQRWAASH